VTVRLDRLLHGLEDARLLHGTPEVEIASVQHDSRRVGPGDCFVCITGLRHDGHDFIPQALAAGARALVVEAPPAAAGIAWGDTAVVQVPEARRALAHLAVRFHQHPTRRLTLIGVTGTNGKTTSTYLLEAILAAAGRRAGVIGTVSYRWAGRTRPAERTTPEATDLQALLRQMAAQGADAVVMEVSSHALALHRVDGCEFDAALFTNLTQDHLDFHRTFGDYLRAKARLFEGLGVGRTKPGEAAAVLNADDPSAPFLRHVTRARVITYGLGPGADVTPRRQSVGWDGIRLDLRTPWGDLSVASPLVGEHNVSNILGCVTAARQLGVPAEAAAAGVRGLARVPGRFEKVEAGQPFGVVVDYAHTPDALERVLRTARAGAAGRVLVVFGCGGDRDAGKRPLMGEAAARLADLAILTSDNPRGEDPERIIDAIEAGARKACRPPRAYARMGDRRAAIGEALRRAAPGDLVLIAGKGHEATQVIGNTVLPFDDVQVARDLLAGLGFCSDHPVPAGV
jgi:UDP-N-acetylmuramoyl-L-alanyl-D-glutamate--2,6-diaminopimelate ligase